MSEATWKRRFRATTVMFPTWSRERPERLLYLSNAGGKFEVCAWDQRTGEHRQVTDRAEGTGYRVSSRLDPPGDWIWWFDDEKGNELGRWVREPWQGGPRETIAPQLAPAYSGRIAIHSGGPAIDQRFAVIARSRSDEGTSVYVVADGQAPRRIYAHEQSAFIDGLSRASGIAPRCTVLLLDADRYAIYDPLQASRPKDPAPLRAYFIERASALGYKVVDMAPVFTADYARRRMKFDYWPVDRHWNRRGHELAASAVMEALFPGDGNSCMPGEAAPAS